jgi:hypothetical protein
MGLTVKQRKTLLRLINQYKLALRVKRANAYIMEHGATLEPIKLQQGVYDIMYGHIYDELAWREARVPLVAAWREEIAEWKNQHLQDHSNLRGLREPGLMEMAKVEAMMLKETLKWKRAGYDKLSERLAMMGEEGEEDDVIAGAAAAGAIDEEGGDAEDAGDGAAEEK